MNKIKLRELEYFGGGALLGAACAVFGALFVTGRRGVVVHLEWGGIAGTSS